MRIYFYVAGDRMVVDGKSTRAPGRIVGVEVARETKARYYLKVDPSEDVRWWNTPVSGGHSRGYFPYVDKDDPRIHISEADCIYAEVDNYCRRLNDAYGEVARIEAELAHLRSMLDD